MIDNVIHRNDHTYRIYTTGFVGSNEVILTPEFELEKTSFYGVGMMRTISRDMKYSICVASNEIKDKKIENDIFLIDSVLKLALKHFGPNFEEWIAMHDTDIAKKSSLIGHENVAWIRETLEWLSGIRDERRISTVVWGSIITGADGINSEYISRQLHDTIKVAKTRLGIPLNNYLSTKTVLQAWLSKNCGATDLKDTLAMMYTSQ